MGVRGVYKKDSSGKRYLAYTIKDTADGKTKTTKYTSSGKQVIDDQAKVEAEAQARIQQIAKEQEVKQQEVKVAEQKVQAQQTQQRQQTQAIAGVTPVQTTQPQFFSPLGPQSRASGPTFIEQKQQEDKERVQRIQQGMISPTKVSTEQKIGMEIDRRTSQGQSSFIGGLKEGVIGFATPFKAAGETIASPIQTTKNLFSFGKSAFTDPVGTGKLIFSDYKTKLDESPTKFIGEVAGDLVLGTYITKAIRIGRQKVSDVKVKWGAQYIPPEQVYSSQVLTDGKTFPTITKSSEVYTQFRKADDIVTTASPQKISGTVAGPGRKGEVFLEDPGIYTTPKGQGSPAFLRIEPTNSEFEFSLIPDIKPTRPTIAEFQTQGIGKIPKGVLDVPGFKATGDYAAATLAPAGKVYVSKRSQIGIGELPRQTFTVADDFTSPITGRNIPKGARILEAGTSEGELIIPMTAKFQPVSGQKQYTTYQGRVVAIDQYKLIGAADDVASVGKPTTPTTTSQQVYKGIREYSELSQPKPTQITPSYFAPSSRASIGTAPSSDSSNLVTVSSSYVGRPAPSKPGVSGPVSEIFGKSTPTYEPTMTPISSSPTSKPSRSTSTSGGSGGGSSTPPSSPSPYTPPPSQPTLTPYGGGSSVTRSTIYESSRELFKYRQPKFQQEQRKSFEVFVKRGKEFERVKTFGEASSALQFGRSYIGSRALASFQVREAQSGRALKAFEFGPSIRVSKRDPYTFVEKRERRIKSKGELQEITFKGIASTRNRRY
jgi:hypothetical protein